MGADIATSGPKSIQIAIIGANRVYVGTHLTCVISPLHYIANRKQQGFIPQSCVATSELASVFFSYLLGPHIFPVYFQKCFKRLLQSWMVSWIHFEGWVGGGLTLLCQMLCKRCRLRLEQQRLLSIYLPGNWNRQSAISVHHFCFTSISKLVHANCQQAPFESVQALPLPLVRRAAVALQFACDCFRFSPGAGGSLATGKWKGWGWWFEGNAMLATQTKTELTLHTQI